MVKRWVCTDDECLHEDDAGDMVLHSDYAELEAEHAALRAKADRMAGRLEYILAVLDPEQTGPLSEKHWAYQAEYAREEANAALADYRGEGKP